MLANLVGRTAHALGQRIELARRQLEKLEQLRGFLELFLRLSAVAGMLLDRADRFRELLAQFIEALPGELRIRPAFYLVGIGAVVALLFFLVVRFRRCLLRTGLARRFGRRGCRDFVGRLQIPGKDVGKAPLFGRYEIVFLQYLLDRSGKIGDRSHGFPDAFLDPLGNLDLAFTRQQFHRAHFAHIHAHRVGRASRFGFHRREGGYRLVGDFVGLGVAAGEQQRFGVGRFLEDLYPEVVDHLDDLFDLIRIRNVFGQMVVHLGIGQIILFLGLGDEIFQARLLGWIRHS